MHIQGCQYESNYNSVVLPSPHFYHYMSSFQHSSISHTIKIIHEMDVKGQVITLQYPADNTLVLSFVLTHTLHNILECFSEHDKEPKAWPPNSPDPNPIEHS